MHQLTDTIGDCKHASAHFDSHSRLALSQAAVEYGIALAKSVDAKVTVLTVSTPFHILAVEPAMVTDTAEQHAKQVAAHAKKYLDTAKEVALAAGVVCETVHLEHDHPYLAIIETAARKSCDLIVMASHGRRGISAAVLGSETSKVLTHSSIPGSLFARQAGRFSLSNSVVPAFPSSNCRSANAADVSETTASDGLVSRFGPGSDLTQRKPYLPRQLIVFQCLIWRSLADGVDGNGRCLITPGRSLCSDGRCPVARPGIKLPALYFSCC